MFHKSPTGHSHRWKVFRWLRRFDYFRKELICAWFYVHMGICINWQVLGFCPKFVGCVFYLCSFQIIIINKAFLLYTIMSFLHFFVKLCMLVEFHLPIIVSCKFFLVNHGWDVSLKISIRVNTHIGDIAWRMFVIS